MKKSISRRDALKHVASTGAAAVLGSTQALSQDKPLEVAGKPVEVTLTSVTPETVRITIQPVDSSSGVLKDGALLKEDFGTPAAKVKTLGAARTVKCGR